MLETVVMFIVSYKKTSTFAQLIMFQMRLP